MIRKLKILSVIALLFTITASLYSQLGIEIASDRKTYLQYEPIYIKVSIRNYSGKTLVFGETDDMQGTIKFFIDTPNNTIADLRKKNYNPLIGIILPAGGAEQAIVPLNRLYFMNQIGNYRVRAIVSHKLLPSSYESKPITLGVCSGKVLWEKPVGIPQFRLNENETKHQERTYKLVSFYDGTGHIYALVVEDEDRVYGVARIGKDIGSNPPECEIDGLSRVHILIPVSPALFAYFCYNLDCEIEEKAAYLRTSSCPTLVLDPKEGTVLVAGGKKAVKDMDYIENEDGMPTFR